MKNDYSFWEWKPLVSFGVFRFGASLGCYKNLRLIYLNEESTIYEEKQHQELNDYAYTILKFRYSLRIYADYKKIIHSVSSEEMFFYNGIDLLNCSIEEIVQILDKNYDTLDEMEVLGEIQHSYFFDQLGLCVWEVNKRVIKIVASTAYE